MDLFNDITFLPQEVQDIFNEYADRDELTYKECETLQKQANQFGYNFDWDLDGVPYNLRIL